MRTAARSKPWIAVPVALLRGSWPGADRVTGALYGVERVGSVEGPEAVSRIRAPTVARKARAEVGDTIDLKEAYARKFA